MHFKIGDHVDENFPLCKSTTTTHRKKKEKRKTRFCFCWQLEVMRGHCIKLIHNSRLFYNKSFSRSRGFFLKIKLFRVLELVLIIKEFESTARVYFEVHAKETLVKNQQSTKEMNSNKTCILTKVSISCWSKWWLR